MSRNFAWRGPRAAKPAPPRVAPAVRPAVMRTPPRTPPPLTARPSTTAYYNPARIIDRSQLKIVDSIAAERQKDFAEERGDTVAPTNGGGNAARRNFVDTSAKEVSDKPGAANLIVPAIIAYLLFGG